MKWSNGDRMKLMLIAIMATFAFGSARAKADFIFTEPVNLGPTVNSQFWDSGPRISADGLSLFFESDRPGGLGGLDLWMTSREAIGEPWSEPVNLGPNINTQDWEMVPAVSPNGLELYFTRSLSTWDTRIFVSTRPSKDASWSPAIRLGPPINSYPASHPEFSSDGLSLYFCSNGFRPGGLGRNDIWIATRTAVGEPWSEPVNPGPNVNSPKHEYAPSISSDGKILIFDSYRVSADQVWLTVRSEEDDSWDPPMLLGPEINSSNYMGGPEISPDGLSLYYTARDSSLEIYESKILPIVDLNADGIVDSVDIVIMVDHWGTDNSLCDIGPMPWGDGIVDVLDLVVLTKYIEPIDHTLIAHWELDEIEGDIAQDSTVGDNDADVFGDPIWQPDGGKEGGALQFDGIDDYLSTDFVLNPSDGAFSVIAWLKGGEPGQVVISQQSMSDWLATDIDSQLMTELKCTGRSSGPLYSETIVTDGQWHRIGLVWDGSYRTLYVDGFAVAEDTQHGLEGSQMGLYIGAGKDMETGTYFSGLIDDIRIYNVALSKEEIEALTK